MQFATVQKALGRLPRGEGAKPHGRPAHEPDPLAGRSAVLRYGVAVLAVEAALLFKLVLAPLIGRESSYLLFFVPVMLAGWYGGRGPGVLATLLAALFSDYFFLNPIGAAAGAGPRQYLSLALFLLEGLVVSWFSAALQASRRRAVASEREARQHEQTLRRSEERYRLLVAGVRDYAIILLDPDGYIVSWNAGAERIKGYRASEILGKHVSLFHTEEDRGTRLPDYELVVARREGRYEGAGWRLRKDGTLFWASVLITALWDPAGKLRGFAKVTRDATELKRAEEERAQLLASERVARREAEASEQRYRSLAEAIPGVVWTAQPDGWFDYFNRRWFETTGLTAEASYGTGWQSALHPDDRERGSAQWAEAVRSGEDFDIQYRFRQAADGAFRWYLTRAVAVRDPEGTVLKWVGTSTDIDDQKRAAEATRFLAEAGAALASSRDVHATLAGVARLAVPDLADWCAIDIREPDGSIARPGAAHADADKLDLVRQLAQHDSPDEAALFTPARVLATGRADFYPDVPWGFLDTLAPEAAHVGVLRELGLRSYLCVPLRVRGHTLGALTLVSARATRRYGAADFATAERLAYRAALAVDNARLFAEAEESNRLKDEFLTTLSHELRTPLTSMLGWAQLLRTGKLDAESAARGLQTIERSAKLQTQLIEDLLDISRIVSGKVRLEVRPVELTPVIEAALDAMRPSAQAKGIGLEAVVAGKPGAVIGDPDRLQQVIWNLLSNALKYTDPGGRIEVRLDRAGRHARVRVTDDGRGIPAEFLPHVFERFRQADSSMNRTDHGLGLGLAIARHLVELHGGTIEAASPGVDRGATFTVLLPVAAVGPAQAKPAPETPETVTPRLALKDLRLLVVDDEADARDVLAAVLELRGAQVTTAGSTAEALAAIERVRPDVLLSDIGMPGEDGYELMRKLRARGTRIPAAALTAYAREEDRRRALSAGYQVHVAKPVEPAQLAAVVADLAGRAATS